MFRKGISKRENRWRTNLGWHHSICQATCPNLHNHNDLHTQRHTRTSKDQVTILSLPLLVMTWSPAWYADLKKRHVIMKDSGGEDERSGEIERCSLMKVCVITIMHVLCRVTFRDKNSRALQFVCESVCFNGHGNPFLFTISVAYSTHTQQKCMCVSAHGQFYIGLLS